MTRMTQKRPGFTLIRSQKANFAQIQHLFGVRYCLYEQAGSFPDTFIESRLSQDTLGKYFYSMGTIGNPRNGEQSNILAQISTFSYIVKNFKLDFLKKGSPKKYKTQDFKWSYSTCKKLLKHFFQDIFLFQEISEDKCGLGPFGTNYYGFSVFSIFKVVKAKKATIVAKYTKLHSGASGYPKLLFQT